MSGFIIQTVTAFVAVDTDGNEGVMGANLGGTFYPLVCADDKRISYMYPMAEEISKATGMQYKIVQFSHRVDVTDQVKEKYKK